MAGALVPGTHWNESEFQVIPTTTYCPLDKKTVKAGTRLFGLCGVNAYAMVRSSLEQRYISTASQFLAMAPRSLCDSMGRTTLGAIQQQARNDGYTHTAMLSWNGNGYAANVWEQFATQHLLAGAALILETNAGQVLKDYVRGTGEDATGLQRHLIGIVGYNAGGANGGTDWSPTLNRNVPFGFFTLDGCNDALNPSVNGARQRLTRNWLFYYTASNLAASKPGGILAIYPKVVAKPAPAPAPQPAPAPTSTTAYTVTYTADELRALESLLARLPKP